MTTVRWPWLLIAMALLVPPPFLSSELRKVVISVRRNASLTVASLARPWQNWIDFIRALIGVAILANIAITAEPVGNELKDAGNKVLLLQFGLITFALLLQVMRIDKRAPRPEHRIQLLTPIFYLCGITLVLGGALPGTFALLVGWIFAIGAKNPAYQLPAMAVALFAAGYVFGLNMALILNIVLIMVPYFSAFAFGKRLVFVGLQPSIPHPLLKAS